ncbi:MAG: Gfo/Idh/MocA family protein [Methylobacter sp.]
MIKVAIIGCGKIADSHVGQIQRIPGSRIVGVCDAEELMAKQLSQRCSAEKYFRSVPDLLAETKPDVVHITTPPNSHFDLAMQCMTAGCHVYVEKPFTVTYDEANALVVHAAKNNLKLTVGHDDQFTPATLRMRKLINTGYLGGKPLHMESHYCYELGSEGYAKALLGDRNHWVRKLPGKLLQNIISHGISRIAEFINSDQPLVIAHGFTSPLLMQMGETDICDELRVIIKDADGVTAYFTFSSQIRPSLHQFRVYGAKNGLILDHDQQTVVKLEGHRRKSYLEKFVSPLALAQEYVSNVKSNGILFARRDFHMKSGMKHLIEEFYNSIATGTPLPIDHREILLTARLMDDIFYQIRRPNHES